MGCIKNSTRLYIERDTSICSIWHFVKKNRVTGTRANEHVLTSHINSLFIAHTSIRNDTFAQIIANRGAAFVSAANYQAATKKNIFVHICIVIRRLTTRQVAKKPAHLLCFVAKFEKKLRQQCRQCEQYLVIRSLCLAHACNRTFSSPSSSSLRSFILVCASSECATKETTKTTTMTAAHVHVL